MTGADGEAVGEAVVVSAGAVVVVEVVTVEVTEVTVVVGLEVAATEDVGELVDAVEVVADEEAGPGV